MTDPRVQVRKYIAALPPGTRKAFKQLRGAIREAAPGVTDTFSYGIPGFRLDDLPLVSYAAWRQHLSIYPMTERIRRAHAAALTGYKTAKGTVQFPIAEPVPVPLVKRLIKARVAEARAKAKAKKKKR